MPHVQAQDGTSLFYNDWGAGRPVVLIHGWPLNADMWEYQASVLVSSGFRVIAYDRRGFGRSEQPWSGYDYDTLAADLAALMDKLDLHQAALVGFSMGGGEVVRYLSRHGTARVTQAVLLAGVPPFMLRTADNPDGIDRSVFDGIVDGLNNDRPGFLAGFGKKVFGAGLLTSPVSAEFMQWILMMAMQASKQATVDCVRAFSETDFRPDMAAVTVPTLVVHGDGDVTVPIATAGRSAARMLPSARLLEYPGAPHGLFYTERVRFNEDLLSFLQS